MCCEREPEGGGVGRTLAFFLFFLFLAVRIAGVLIAVNVLEVVAPERREVSENAGDFALGGTVVSEGTSLKVLPDGRVVSTLDCMSLEGLAPDVGCVVVCFGWDG